LGWLLIRMRSGWIPTRNVARISVRNCTHISTKNGTASAAALRRRAAPGPGPGAGNRGAARGFSGSRAGPRRRPRCWSPAAWPRCRR
jgi:hypothetical protein